MIFFSAAKEHEEEEIQHVCGSQVTKGFDIEHQYSELDWETNLQSVKGLHNRSDVILPAKPNNLWEAELYTSCSF